MLSSNTSSSSSPYNKYIPPSRTPSPRTEKSEPKKRHPNATSTIDFPSLASTINTNNNNSKKSFANAARTEVATPKKIISDTKPGWVYIRKHNGEIQYKYGKPSDHPPYSSDIYDTNLGNLLVKYRLEKEQYSRDCDIERLGDLSEYYDVKTLQEQFADEERIFAQKTFNSSDSEDEYIQMPGDEY
jgi:hypothetical protein